MSKQGTLASNSRGAPESQTAPKYKAAFYLRSATGNFDDLQKQRKLLERESKKFGITEADIFIYIDSLQSGLQDGPALMRLKSDILKGRINFVFVSRLNRISRCLNGLSSFLNFARNNKFRFVSHKENMDSTYWNFLGGGK